MPLLMPRPTCGVARAQLAARPAVRRPTDDARARQVRKEKEIVVAGARKEAAEARQRKQEVDAVWDEE